MSFVQYIVLQNFIRGLEKCDKPSKLTVEAVILSIALGFALCYLFMVVN